jgi:hypothetical protein
MADCDNIFKEFDQKIKLSTPKKNSMRISRNSLRDKVRTKFRDKGHEVKFHWQGSFAMDTIITPEDGDYDIDDGIYLLVEQEPEVAISTLHRWVAEAAENHTSQKPKDKDPCVRVLFKDGYHVDLVIYYKTEFEHPYLAHKRDGWIVGDPKEFMDWFNGRTDTDGQLKRIVRYFKAWRDHLRGDMPSGLIFTILATDNIVYDNRDDIAFLETMRKIQNTLISSFVCYRPTTPSNEDLFANYSDTRKNYFLDRLDSFICSGEQALEEVYQVDACQKWKKHFGERFFCPSGKARKSPVIIKHSNPPPPHGTTR